MPGELLAVECVLEPVTGHLAGPLLGEGVEGLPLSVTCLPAVRPRDDAQLAAGDRPSGVPPLTVSGFQNDVQAPVHITLPVASWSDAYRA